jgi:hypothetical protein
MASADSTSTTCMPQSYTRLDTLVRLPERISLITVKQIDDYFAAWNEPATERRRALLARTVTPDVELVHPTWGRSHETAPSSLSGRSRRCSRLAG